ncbi:hypothetical protein [Streptacidiphilus anmyonensis]|uniref:hypothetical protein n=1 Tax=Streptacidiphilus anmyonensis TaxID=405782 RepID=UPI00128C1BE6|nr:hypothetical protein [Streptacidiphilus anmyonensis]
MPRKGLMRVGSLALGACVTVLAVPGLANASVPPTPVNADSACQALELTKIIDGHDHMFVDPTVDKGDCLFTIADVSTGNWIYISQSPNGDQPAPDGIYDGPGVTLQVEVVDQAHPDVWALGPKN